MTLPATGSISMSQIRTEIEQASGIISLNDAKVRQVAEKPSGIISFADLRGKSYFSYTITQSAITGYWNAPVRVEYWSKGFMISINAPEGLVVDRVRIYNSDGSLWVESGYTRPTSQNSFVMLAGVTNLYMSNNALSPATNQFHIGMYNANNTGYTRVFGSIEVRTTDGKWWPLSKHKNLNCINGNILGSVNDLAGFFSKIEVSSYHGIPVLPNV